MNFYGFKSEAPPHRINRLDLVPNTSMEEIWLTDFIRHLQDHNVQSIRVSLHNTDQEMQLNLSNVSTITPEDLDEGYQ
jgi:hypothetical protein